MDIDHFEMIGGMVVLTVVMVFAIQFQISQMENLEEVSGNWISGEGSKAAASFHVANEGEQIGKITESTKKSLKEDDEEGCTSSLTGLRPQDKFRFTWLDEDECGPISDSITRVRIPVAVEENGKVSSISYLETGIPDEERDHSAEESNDRRGTSYSDPDGGAAP